MLRGDPGGGTTVLRARGLEDEAELAVSGLADLFRPVVDQLRRIPPAQGAALAGARGLGPPVAGARFVVGVATLSLLAAAAEARPVLATVDDTQWLDSASSEALFFASRRLEAEQVALLMTSREPKGAAPAPAECARALSIRPRRYVSSAPKRYRLRPAAASQSS